MGCRWPTSFVSPAGAASGSARIVRLMSPLRGLKKSTHLPVFPRLAHREPHDAARSAGFRAAPIVIPWSDHPGAWRATPPHLRRGVPTTVARVSPPAACRKRGWGHPRYRATPAHAAQAFIPLAFMTGSISRRRFPPRIRRRVESEISAPITLASCDAKLRPWMSLPYRTWSAPSSRTAISV